MKLLYIGYAIPKDICDHQRGASVAGNNMQIGVVQELKKKFKDDMEILTIYPTAPYPKVKKLWVRKKQLRISDNCYVKCVSYLNIPIVKQIWQVFSVYVAARKFISNNKQTKILTFNAFPAIGLPVKYLSEKYNCETICLLADLPIDMEKRNIISKFLRILMDKLTEISIKNFDKLIVLNQRAIKEYAPETPYIIVDGGFSPKENKCEKEEKRIYEQSGEVILLFSGSLVEYNGIRQLIESMKYVYNNVKLYIYGDGPLRRYVMDQCITYSNIEYKGKVPNEEMIKIQKKVYMLINPRPKDDPISLVTFPSKIFEYMLSGTPVLTTKLNGLTKAYLEHISILDDENAEKMGESINKALKVPYNELMSKAAFGKEFILKEKNWGKQSKKIFNFIK
ncbi:glycosyltransferase [Metabacillus sp. FJAT-52054]|uniref:Glycosyltransferase n=1 Tax=Metabacillus sediminis TaxID=3117746 RepID=A0ABZ2NGB5_9BACI